MVTKAALLSRGVVCVFSYTFLFLLKRFGLLSPSLTVTNSLGVCKFD
jgi:hypothetical protein